jgi:NAD/NADP transhydrogenase beta subunit
MRIAVTQDISVQEHRVALVPDAAERLVKQGVEVCVEAGVGESASGIIMTQMVCRSMNRSLPHVLFGSFGTDEHGGGRNVTPQADKSFHSIDAEETAMMLTYAHQVVIVPGYGMAVAQAQHAVHDLVELLKKHGAIWRWVRRHDGFGE